MKIGDKVIHRRKKHVNETMPRPDFIGTIINIEPCGRFVTVQGELYKECFDIKEIKVIKKREEQRQ